MPLKLPAVIALVCLLSGCASTTRPSALAPVIAPDVKTPPPAAFMTLPVPPDPLEPGYGRTH